jgi:hypothetical protein
MFVWIICHWRCGSVVQNGPYTESRVVDQDIHVHASVSQLTVDGVCRIRLGQVLGNDRDADPATSELIGHLVESLVVSGDNHEIKAVAYKQLRELVPNPAGCPGHESGSPINAAADHPRTLLVHHAPLPAFGWV